MAVIVEIFCFLVRTFVFSGSFWFKDFWMFVIDVEEKRRADQLGIQCSSAKVSATF